MSAEHGCATPQLPPPAAIEFRPALVSYVEELVAATGEVPAQRREQLERIARFIDERRASGRAAKLVFICTHNSRRSQLSQLWALVATAYHGVDGVETFSGGTEATAFNPRAVAALRRAGFAIDAPGGETDNPRYVVSYADDHPPIEAFSKKYSDPPNPTEDFAAIMTCSDADKSCPFVQGAVVRVALPYVDPKASDGTSEESQTYDARSRQIATEMFYLFSQVGRS